ncbi:mannose-1-phosphate guanylyltransferase/mannose-6-phosphate isomerase [Sphingomonas sp. GlSt437]|uniref:mannose-1-phosphate guanylyltransferase/mannose-6-phosphate isomerase n=2 Tax=Sphingomonas sp. GlSt437 TaxID=3389970 RepID=UPI003EBA04BF
MPVILSGGAGTRLWPMSTPERPKQFFALGHDTHSLLQQAALRGRDLPEAGPAMVVASDRHADLVTMQLADVNCAIDALILEPVGRNTAPAIAVAALTARAPDTLLLVMPSDQVITDVGAFGAAVAKARPLAEQGWLITFGIEPSRPETGYGYIRLGEPLADGVHRVDRFVEKPDRDRAKAMLASGDHGWNAGIFLFRADAMLAALAEHAPDVLAAARAACDLGSRNGERLLLNPDAFAQAPSISIDYAVMERSNRVAVVPVSMGWTDLGSWDAIHDFGPASAEANVHHGDIIALDTKNCLIRADGLRVAAVGVEDLIIVASGDTVLILPRGQSQDVKRVMDAL